MKKHKKWRFLLQYKCLTGAAVHSLLQDLELIVELCKQGALAERSRDEASLKLVSDVVTSCNLLLGVSGLGQQLHKHKHMWTSKEDKDTRANRKKL